MLGPAVLALAAYARPGYFTSTAYLGGLLSVECVIAAVWMYRKVFFPLVMLVFLLAGVDLPVGSVWTAARWGILGVGALVGSVIMLKERRYHFGFFHVLAVFAVLAALVSALESRHYSGVALLKVLSLLSLFVYAATGARLAVAGRENRFFAGLITGCEVFVAAIGLAYIAGIEVMGNPNSLGAVTGVVGAPVLLWGTMVTDERFVRRRRMAILVLCLYLVFSSHARAGMVAAFMSCGLLCVALRRYRLLTQGIVAIAILVATYAIVRPEAFSQAVSSFTATVVFKGKDPTEGLMESRKNPWQDAVETIHKNFWFGTGFGTLDNGQDASDTLGKFASVEAASAEHGSSYLAITTWVGMVGVAPFLILVAVLLKKIAHTVKWMLRTNNPFHPAIPLAMVILAGLIHAGFEDWLFAPGYYLSVFFWCMAFILVDEAPSPVVADSRRVRWQPRAVPGLRYVAPSR